MGCFAASACGGASGNGASELPGNGGKGTGGATGSGASVGLGGGTTGSGANGSGASAGLDPNNACTGTSEQGERIPVDLFFMVDTTGSMNCPVPDSATNPCEVDPGPPYSSTTRWVVESAALTSFMNASANTGMGVGIAYFPSSNNTCSANTYAKPAVEIADLPGAASALDASINAQKPAGNTPTLASLTGAIQHATSWATAHPGHKVAVVYSTDGYPVGCDNTNTIANAAAVAQTAYNGNPSISTFVLGVGRNLSSLNQIAMSGGTGQAYLIDTTGDAASQLSAALDSIRGRALVGCTYTIPPAPSGQQLDYGKVNVQITSSSGQVTQVLQDPSTTGCTQGWQYSPDKTQINLCGDACNEVKSDSGSSLQVLFGCMTQVVPR